MFDNAGDQISDLILQSVYSCKIVCTLPFRRSLQRENSVLIFFLCVVPHLQESEIGPLVAAMQTSLNNLSARLRTKEEEACALKSTVQKECQERMTLMAELMFYRGAGHDRDGEGCGLEAGRVLAWVAGGGGGGESSQKVRASSGEHNKLSHELHCDLTGRSPSCPPTLGHKGGGGEKGWGLPSISRGPSPAQLHESRLTKERVNNGGRLKRQ